MITVKVRRIWWRIASWIDAHMPTTCGRCGALALTKDTHTVHTTWGMRVRVCGNCHHNLYGEGQ